jgi:hypothetical protein
MPKRFMKSVLLGTLAVAASAIVVGSASGEQGSTLPKAQAGIPSPGYDDFPNVLRRQDKLAPTETQQLDAAVARVTNTKFVSGYSDFPNALLLHNTLTPTGRKQLDAAIGSTTASVSSSGSDFSWGDAGVGIAIGLAIAGGLVAVSVVAIRRNRTTPVPA